MTHTHELINLHISAMAYYINTLDGERSVHGWCELVYLKIGGVSYKTMNYYWANIQKFPTNGISWGKTQTLTDFFM